MYTSFSIIPNKKMHLFFSVVLNGEIQKPQIDFLRFLCYNKGVGIARCICKTNAKLAINTEAVYEVWNMCMWTEWKR